MGFEFSDHVVPVQIEGREYRINMGDAKLLDQVGRWGAKLSGTDYASLGEGRMDALAEDVRGYLLALLGQEQFDEVFAERGFDFINGLELFAYLYNEVEKSSVDASFRSVLGKYLPNAAWEDADA